MIPQDKLDSAIQEIKNMPIDDFISMCEAEGYFSEKKEEHRKLRLDNVHLVETIETSKQVTPFVSSITKKNLGFSFRLKSPPKERKLRTIGVSSTQPYFEVTRNECLINVESINRRSLEASCISYAEQGLVFTSKTTTCFMSSAASCYSHSNVA